VRLPARLKEPRAADEDERREEKSPSFQADILPAA
jgi:hypothetical protein